MTVDGVADRAQLRLKPSRTGQGAQARVARVRPAGALRAWGSKPSPMKKDSRTCVTRSSVRGRWGPQEDPRR